MKNIKYLLFIIGCTAMVFSCTPDDPKFGVPPRPSDLKYTVTQDPSYTNKVFLQSLTPGIIPYWDYELGSSNHLLDTVIIPFKGTFWVKYRALGAGGSTTDSTEITISQFDPNYFSDPVWQLLTNGEKGRSWKLVAVKAGDAKSTGFSDWGDASWINPPPPFGDSAHFDLDKGFNFIRYTSGVPKKSTFGINLNEVLPDAYLNTPGKALFINGGNKMPANDVSNQMTASNKSRFRILKINSDTLILGQGGFYTSTPTDSYCYFHWYIRNK